MSDGYYLPRVQGVLYREPGGFPWFPVLVFSGPDVVKAVTQEEVTQESLGGATSHTTLSGVAHAAFDNDIEALRSTRELFGFLPMSNKGKPPAKHKVFLWYYG